MINITTAFYSITLLFPPVLGCNSVPTRMTHPKLLFLDFTVGFSVKSLCRGLIHLVHGVQNILIIMKGESETDVVDL